MHLTTEQGEGSQHHRTADSALCGPYLGLQYLPENWRSGRNRQAVACFEAGREALGDYDSRLRDNGAHRMGQIYSSHPQPHPQQTPELST